jgi:tRNA pseudouridine13 synthase
VRPYLNNVGIEVYSTKTEGIGGVIREKVDDFRVEEIAKVNRQINDDGDYLIAELIKEDWDTHHAINEIARGLHISRKRFGWAGTKDKRALTKQMISIYGTEGSNLKGIDIKGIRLREVGRSRRPICLGDLYGNDFDILIRDIDHSSDETRSYIDATMDEMKDVGIPNFFGPQRFGLRRPITHIVGEMLTRGDFEGAAITYIAKPFPGECNDAIEVREYISETMDFRRGYKLMPNFLRYERAMLNHLIANPNDYVGAFRILPLNLLRLFVHAYQSYIFNKILSGRLMSGHPINRALIGDIVCFRNEMGLPDVNRVQKVETKNIEGINRLVDADRAFVTATIIGYKTKISDGVQGEIEKQIFEELDVKTDDFKASIPEISSKGLRREIQLNANPAYVISPDDLHPGRTKVEFRFTLPKGSYATILLREFMKSTKF